MTRKRLTDIGMVDSHDMRKHKISTNLVDAAKNIEKAHARLMQSLKDQQWQLANRLAGTHQLASRLAERIS